MVGACHHAILLSQVRGPKAQHPESVAAGGLWLGEGWIHGHLTNSFGCRSETAMMAHVTSRQSTGTTITIFNLRQPSEFEFLPDDIHLKGDDGDPELGEQAPAAPPLPAAPVCSSTHLHTSATSDLAASSGPLLRKSSGFCCPPSPVFFHSSSQPSAARGPSLLSPPSLQAGARPSTINRTATGSR